MKLEFKYLSLLRFKKKKLGFYSKIPAIQNVAFPINSGNISTFV